MKSKAYRFAVTGILIAAFGLTAGCGADKEVPPDHVKVTLTRVANSDKEALSVYVNDQSMGNIGNGETRDFSFAASVDGNNSIKFCRVGKNNTGFSPNTEFFATKGAEIRVNLVYTYHSIGSDDYDVTTRGVKPGESLSDVESVVVSDLQPPRPFRFVVANGNPGDKHHYDHATSWSGGFHHDNQLSGKAQIGVISPIPIGVLTAKVEAEMSRRAIEYRHDTSTTNISCDFTVPESGNINVTITERYRTATMKCRIDGVTREFRSEILCALLIEHDKSTASATK